MCGGLDARATSTPRVVRAPGPSRVRTEITPIAEANPRRRTDLSLGAEWQLRRRHRRELFAAAAAAARGRGGGSDKRRRQRRARANKRRRPAAAAASSSTVPPEPSSAPLTEPEEACAAGRRRAEERAAFDARVTEEMAAKEAEEEAERRARNRRFRAISPEGVVKEQFSSLSSSIAPKKRSSAAAVGVAVDVEERQLTVPESPALADQAQVREVGVKTSRGYGGREAGLPRGKDWPGRKTEGKGKRLTRSASLAMPATRELLGAGKSRSLATVQFQIANVGSTSYPPGVFGSGQRPSAAPILPVATIERRPSRAVRASTRPEVPSPPGRAELFVLLGLSGDGRERRASAPPKSHTITDGCHLQAAAAPATPSTRTGAGPQLLLQPKFRLQVLRLQLRELGVELVLVPSAAYPRRCPSASCTCRIFSLCSLMSSMTRSTSSMLVSLCSCFIAPALDLSALNVSTSCWSCCPPG